MCSVSFCPLTAAVAAASASGPRTGEKRNLNMIFSVNPTPPGTGAVRPPVNGFTVPAEHVVCHITNQKARAITIVYLSVCWPVTQ